MQKKRASKVGLNLISWTFETPDSIMLAAQGGGWYYKSIANKIANEGDMINVLDILKNDVKIKGLFTDFPAMVSYYTNCMEKDKE